MKIHYINILFFAFPLNILVHNQRNHNSIPHHTQKIPTTRLLCECELYAPANYDNDPQMKKVMEQFKNRTSERFHEYDDRMENTRQKCKDKCDKEIQKIILKDKLEKELMDKFATLQTDIQNDAIPTCICEKSMADKVEKDCLKCTQNLGGIVAPSSGVLGGIAEGALYVWRDAAIIAAKEAAIAKGAAEGAAAGLKAGKDVVIWGLEHFKVDVFFPRIFNSIGTEIPLYDAGQIAGAIVKEHDRICALGTTGANPTCLKVDIALGLKDVNGELIAGPARSEIPKIINRFVADAKGAAETTKANVTLSKTTEFTTENIAAVDTAYGGFHTAIIASIVAIVIIVLIMVIIYLILRYRRKKKMNKKLQYIKLLEE
ncbi:rifin PIR protein, putative [Plasmodium reichenowi]|uniref:Rifin PIR protein, putative n=1 Tax=Plasmodium reichenowi TaxID=5854 RepID=A0A2P9D4P9_PLARE|nr:rifin PIR protein, putative [Plasmodium reichenowi]